MNADILDSLKQGNLILFLGAGAALGCKSVNGQPLPTSAALAAELADLAKFKYQGEPLAQVYKAAKRKLQDNVHDYLVSRFQNVAPSKELTTLCEYPLPRIYTTNIDDSLETALTLAHRRFFAKSRQEKIVDIDDDYKSTQVVYLNGSIKRRADGILFSPNEYGQENAITSPWYKEVISDLHRYTFVFIGTKLNEPIFFQELEHFRQYFGAKNRRHYLICPNATEIEIEGILDENIEYIDANLELFSDWLKQALSPPPTPLSVVYTRHPELNLVPFIAKDESAILKFTKFKFINNKLPGHPDKRKRIFNFYRGFKPTWEDVVDSIPADLHFLENVKKSIEANQKKSGVIALVGPAGSGKSTLLMQTAYWLGSSSGRPVFYLTDPFQEIDQSLTLLDAAIKAPYYLCIDKISSVSDKLQDYFKISKDRLVTIVCTERSSAWENRVKGHLSGHFLDEVRTDHIKPEDAKALLKKLQDYAPFGKLEKLSYPNQIKLILEKSKQQLLIGLIEATTGEGFDDIIRADYNSLSDDRVRTFVGIVGLATVHRLPMPETILSRALTNAGLTENASDLATKSTGIIYKTSSGYHARHSVYVEHLFDNVLSPDEKYSLITNLLDSFEVYETPLARNIGRLENSIFKLTVNNRFLMNQLKSDRNLVLSVYQRYEKFFSSDGLFWLQYGLCLRTLSMHTEALAKLSEAKTIYPIKQTLHAYAQQLFINAYELEDSVKAISMSEEAKGILRELDDAREIGEYPVVTLSEHHVRISHKHQHHETSVALAKEYLAELVNRTRGKNNARAEDAVSFLFKYISHGEIGEIRYREPN